jgi:hypothetical protein
MGASVREEDVPKAEEPLSASWALPDAYEAIGDGGKHHHGESMSGRYSREAGNRDMAKMAMPLPTQQMTAARRAMQRRMARPPSFARRRYGQL